LKLIKWAEATNVAPEAERTGSLPLALSRLNPIRKNPNKRTIMGTTFLWCFKYEGKRELAPKTIPVKRIPFSKNRCPRNASPLNAEKESNTGTTRQCIAHTVEVHIPTISRRNRLENILIDGSL
jgi:hypothetical protein